VIFHGLNFGIDFTGAARRWATRAGEPRDSLELRWRGRTRCRPSARYRRRDPLAGDRDDTADAAATRDKLLEILRAGDPNVVPRGASRERKSVRSSPSRAPLAMLFAMIMIFIRHAAVPLGSRSAPSSRPCAT
jgi:hypothetical protein